MCSTKISSFARGAKLRGVTVTIMAIVFSCSLFAQSGSNSSYTGTKEFSGQTINVVFSGESPPDKLLKTFTDKTGITVKWQTIGWDALQTKITAASIAKTYFADVTDVDWSRVGEYGRTQWFLPLNKYLPTTDSDIPQLSSFTTKGQLLAIPVDGSIMVTTVNTADFAAAGIKKMPTTFAEYKEDLKILQRSGVSKTPLGIPFAAAEGLSTYWYQTTGAMGGKILDKDFKPLFTDPKSPGYLAMEWMVEAYKTGLVPKGNLNMVDSDVQQSEMAGHLISTIFSDYSGNVGTVYNVPASSKAVDQISYISTPGVSGIGPNLGNPDGMGIPVQAKNVGAAVEFLKWVTSTDVQIAMCGGSDPDLIAPGWFLPMRLTAMKGLFASDKTTQASKLYKLFSESGRPVFPDGAPPWYAEFSNAVYTNIRSAVAGAITVDQAVKALAKTVDTLNKK
jgi:multiple sugar transport system substrate-binding protein